MALARHHPQKTPSAKAERRVRKSEAALLLEARVGENFECSGHQQQRRPTPGCASHRRPRQAELVAGGHGLAVGRRLRIKLMRADVSAGVDFALNGRDPRN